MTAICHGKLYTPCPAARCYGMHSLHVLLLPLQGLPVTPTTLLQGNELGRNHEGIARMWRLLGLLTGCPQSETAPLQAVNAALSGLHGLSLTCHDSQRIFHTGICKERGHPVLLYCFSFRSQVPLDGAQNAAGLAVCELCMMPEWSVRV